MHVASNAMRHREKKSLNQRVETLLIVGLLSLHYFLVFFINHSGLTKWLQAKISIF